MYLQFLLPALVIASGAQAAPAPVDNSFSERDTAVSAVSSSFWLPASTIQTDILAAKGLVNLAFYELTNPPSGSCNLLNAAVRREWSTLSQAERKAYIAAELCFRALVFHPLEYFRFFRRKIFHGGGGEGGLC